MLKIRLTRTGKKGQPSYRVVVAEHTAPVKSNFVDTVGYYNVSRKPRELEIDQEKVKYWISVGAQPTDTVACLLKGLGMKDMDKYIGPRDLKRKKKKASEEDEGGETGSAEVTEAPAEAPAEEAKAEEPKEEPKAEEAPAEEAKAEEPKEEPKTEEPPAEEAAAEEAPAEEAADTPASEEEKSEEAS